MYDHVGWLFDQHFLNQVGDDFKDLAEILGKSHRPLLNRIRKRFRSDKFTDDNISAIIQKYPALIRLLYENFARVHCINQQVREVFESYVSILSFHSDVNLCNLVRTEQRIT